jgi:hypothetical protein
VKNPFLKEETSMSHEKEQLLTQLQDPGARSKVASRFGAYVKDRLREASFFEQIIPSETVTRDECQVSTNHDSLVKIEYLAPKSRASTITFRGEPNANFIRGTKVEVPFITIMSDMFQKPEQEFLAYNFPIGKVIEMQAVQDLSEVQDREGLINAEAAVQALQAEANGGVVTSLNYTSLNAGTAVEYSIAKGEIARTDVNNNAVVHPIQRKDFVRLMSIIDGRRLETAVFLISSVDWNQILAWTVEDAGSPAQSATLYEGIKSNMLLGKRFVRSIKTDILRPGNVYSFTSPEFLGRNYILNNVKFYIDKVINLVKFVAWKDVAMSFINIASIAKLELYSGDASTNNANSILGSVTPVAEDQLGAENNRAGNRQFYPNAVAF